jgi:hypothetical protein
LRDSLSQSKNKYIMSEKEHKLSRAEALELVGDIVKRMMEISKEHDIPLSDPEKFKRDLRVSLLKDLEMFREIEESLPSQTVDVEEDKLILSGEEGGASELAKLKFEIKSDKYKTPINFKITEGEAGYAHSY